MIEYFFAYCFRLPRWLPLVPIICWYLNQSSNHATGRNLPSESNFYMATSYRCSKSALNQLIKCFSLDIPEVCIFVFLIYEKKVFFLGSFSFCKSWTRSNGYGKRKRKNGKKEKFWKTRKNPKLCKISYRPPWRSTTWPNGSPNLRPTPQRPWAASSLTLMGN